MQLVLVWFLDNPVRFLFLLPLVLVVAALFFRGAGGQVQKDPQRAFSSEQRVRIHARAGHRCEHISALGFRCKAKGTQADHIYPHSRGGATSLANAQSLCGYHNLRKSAQIPSRFYMWRLERRRRHYFPDGERVDVYWLQPSSLR